MDWKSKVINSYQDVPFRVLERKYSFDENGRRDEDNGSENRIIRGDNLEALKALLPRYGGLVKCISIDPPYNAGNEGWAYNDNVNDPKIKKWLGEVVGKEGEDLPRHDKWLYAVEDGDMNKLERKLIVELTGLPNVRWWHRNIARQGFVINSFIKRYLDILIMTQSGKFICAETRGDHLKIMTAGSKLPSVKRGARRRARTIVITWCLRTAKVSCQAQ